MSCSTIFFSRSLIAGEILALLFLSGCVFQGRPAVPPNEVESQVVDQDESLVLDKNESLVLDKDEYLVLDRDGFLGLDEDELPVPDEDEFLAVDEDELAVPDEDELLVPDEDELAVPDEEELLAVDEDELAVPDEDELLALDEDELAVPDEEELPVPDEDEFLAVDEDELAVPDEEELLVLDEEELPVPDEDEFLALDEERDAVVDQVDHCGLVDYARRPPLSKDLVIALFPVENLSGRKAPLETATELLRTRLEGNQIHLVEDRILKRFMRRHRIRDTGGLGSRVAKEIKEDTGAEAVLISSLEMYETGSPPKVALISRLVLTGEQPGIIWMDSIGFSGDESPGLLGLGRIRSPNVLLEKSIALLVDSMANYLPEVTRTASVDPSSPCQRTFDLSGFFRRDPRLDDLPQLPRRKGKRRYRPKLFYRSPRVDSSGRYRVAVVPFLNLSQRNHAGNIVALEFVNQLLRSELFTVVEPGVVKEQLLKHRVRMREGPSLAVQDLIASEGSLGADFVISGTVFEYRDALGIPKVDFVIRAFAKSLATKAFAETGGRDEWSSRSYNDGQEGVVFFNVGKRHTAHALVLEMLRGAVDSLSAD